MTVRVLTDFHHHALAESLCALFEDRFGWEVYFPTGMEWSDEEYWMFEKDYRRQHGIEPYDAVARQYLVGIWVDVAADAVVPGWEKGRGIDRSMAVGLVESPAFAPIVLRKDPRHDWRVHKGVTLAAARDMRWDIVLSSLPANDYGMSRFAKERGAIFGVQVGNEAQQSRWDLADFILSSATMPGHGPSFAGRRFTWLGKPVVMMHQEFDLNVFRYEPPEPGGRSVASFMNCFPETPLYRNVMTVYGHVPGFADMARSYSDDFDWKCFGSYGSAPLDEWAAGDVSDIRAVADAMRATTIGWHTKVYSDGFGHVMHNWAAVGRPWVGAAGYYRDKIASPLWVEGVTSFDIAGKSNDEVYRILLRLRDDEDLHLRMSENAAARFREVVDFDAEAEVVRAMLGDVLPS